MRSLRRQDRHHHEAQEVDVDALVERIRELSAAGQLRWSRLGRRGAYWARWGGVLIRVEPVARAVGSWQLQVWGEGENGRASVLLPIHARRYQARLVMHYARRQLRSSARSAEAGLTEAMRLRGQGSGHLGQAEGEAEPQRPGETRDVLDEQAAARALDAFMAWGQTS